MKASKEAVAIWLQVDRATVKFSLRFFPHLVIHEGKVQALCAMMVADTGENFPTGKNYNLTTSPAKFGRAMC